MPTVLTAAPPVSFSSLPSHWLSQENFEVQVSLARNCFFLLVHSFLLTWGHKQSQQPFVGAHSTMRTLELVNVFSEWASKDFTSKLG